MRITSGAGDGFSGDRRVVLEDHLTRELPRLLGLAVALTGNRADAEDLVQEAVLRVVARPRDAVPVTGAYLRRIMINLQIDRSRRSKKNVSVLNTLAADRRSHHDSPDEAVELRMALEQGLQQLPTRHRQVLILRYLEDLPFDEIAVVLGKPPGTVRRLCGEALQQMAELFGTTNPSSPRSSHEQANPNR